MTTTDIIRNEITLQIGHTPDKNEQQKFIDYIHDRISDLKKDGKKIYLSHIEMAILDCRNDNFAQCQECGEWFLPDEMNDTTGCCINCTPYHDPDFWNEI